MSDWRKALKDCDIRGPYPEQVDEELARQLALAVASVARQAGDARVVVAGDIRLSTPSLQAALLDGLRDGGARALDCGRLPTPGYYFARQRLSVAAGVMVTASHGPPGHNGFKPVFGRYPVTPEDLRRLEGLVEAGPPAEAGGSVERVELLVAYVDWLVESGRRMLGPGARALRVVVDCGNGSFSGIAGQVLAALGVAHVCLFCEADGRFPNRSPDVSRPGELAALGQAVVVHGADLGIAFDGDGDRVGFTDERGRTVPADVFVALLARDALERRGPGAVVLDIKLSQAADEVVAAAGGTPIRERSGHTFMKTRVMRDGAVLGGEGSGHVFFPELDGGDDGLYAGLAMLALLAHGGRPMSELAGSVPRHFLTRDIRVPFEGDPQALMEALAQGAEGEARQERLDGVKAHYPEGWALARPSVTEPAITMRFEGWTPEGLRRVIERFLAPAPEWLPEALAAADEATSG